MSYERHDWLGMTLTDLQGECAHLRASAAELLEDARYLEAIINRHPEWRAGPNRTLVQMLVGEIQAIDGH